MPKNAARPLVLIAAASLLLASCDTILPGAPPPLDAAAWGDNGFHEAVFGGYDDRPENDFVFRAVLPAFSDRPAADMPAGISLVDFAGSGRTTIFVQLNDPKWCADGCRTLAYAFEGNRWRLTADGPAVAVEARLRRDGRAAFAYVTRSHGSAVFAAEGGLFRPASWTEVTAGKAPPNR